MSRWPGRRGGGSGERGNEDPPATPWRRLSLVARRRARDEKAEQRGVGGSGELGDEEARERGGGGSGELSDEEARERGGGGSGELGDEDDGKRGSERSS